MAKKKTKKHPTITKKKKLPETITVRVPVHVEVHKKNKIVTFVPEYEDVHVLDKTKNRIHETGLEQDLLGFSKAVAEHVVWIEAEIPVPQIPEAINVKGKVS